jgi:hypothetical protein
LEEVYLDDESFEHNGHDDDDDYIQTNQRVFYASVSKLNHDNVLAIEISTA